VYSLRHHVRTMGFCGKKEREDIELGGTESWTE
jgi:hypothetical protein